MIPATESAVRWHPAPERQAMGEPPTPPVRPPRPDLTELRRRLVAAQQDEAALVARREAARAVMTGRGPWDLGLFDWKGPVVLGGVGLSTLGLGFCSSGSTALQATFYSAGGCCVCCAAGCTACLAMHADADERALAANPTEEELAAARMQVRDLEIEIEAAPAVEILQDLGWVNGQDIVGLVLEYAEPVPPAVPDPAT